MVKGIDDQPDELRRKLALLEGDRKAFLESSKTTRKQNEEIINDLRKKNKHMAARLKALRAPALSGTEELSNVDTKISESIKKAGLLKHEIQSKQLEILELDDQLQIVEREETRYRAAAAGETPEAQTLRTLENNLDKAILKIQEAVHIGGAYQAIIDKLQKERLQYDNKVVAVEQTIKARKQDLSNLEAMYVDANLVRDATRRELAQREQEMNESRQRREAEKQRLDTEAEDRRKQYDLIEKRLRLASAADDADPAVEHGTDEAKTKITTFEEAMRKIQDATGVTDMQEVVHRFLVQGETQDNLKRLQQENTELLGKLREDHARITKEFETLKYSGEARNTSNQRMLAEFEQHLSESQAKLQSAQEGEARTARLLVAVKAGVDHLGDKLEKLKAVQFRAASNVVDKLTEAELRLVNLLEEVDSRKSELGNITIADLPPSKVLPEHNTRIKLTSADNDPSEDSGSDDDDDDYVSRETMKRNAQSMIDAKTKKKKPSKKKKGSH